MGRLKLCNYILADSPAYKEYTKELADQITVVSISQIRKLN